MSAPLTVPVGKRELPDRSVWVLGDGWIAALAAAAVLGACWTRPVLGPAPIPVGMVGAWAAVKARRPLLLCAVALLLCSALGDRALAGLRPAANGPVAGEAVLVSDPETLVAGTRAVARFDGQRVELWAHGAPAGSLRRALAGDVVVLRGRRRPFPEAEIRSRAWRRVVGAIEADRIDGVRGGAWPHRLANELHRRLATGARSLGRDDRALLAGLVLGDDRDQPAVLRDAFDAVGLSHLLAVSGQNVAFVLTAASPLLGRLRLGRRWAVTVALLAFFAVLTRFEPSVLRAVTMAGLAASATALGRPASGVRVLALAVVGLLVVDPLLVRSLGFQLSCAASAGILLLAPPMARRLPLPTALATAVAVPAAAQLATSPLLARQNGGLPAVSLLANVLAEPAAGLVMTWGSSAGLLAGFLPAPLAAAVTLPSRVLLSWISGVALRCARLPPLTVSARALAVVTAAVGLWTIGRRLRPTPVDDDAEEAIAAAPSGPSGPGGPSGWVPAGVALGVAACLWLAGATPPPVARLPAGAALYESGSAEVLLISRPLDTARLLRAVRGHIDGDIELLVVTSPSSGAWRAATELQQRYRVGVVLVPQPRPDATLALAGTVIEVGAVRVEVTGTHPAGAGPALELAVTGGQLLDPPELAAGPAP